jgi:hypothetical protein
VPSGTSSTAQNGDPLENALPVGVVNSTPAGTHSMRSIRRPFRSSTITPDAELIAASTARGSETGFAPSGTATTYVGADGTTSFWSRSGGEPPAIARPIARTSSSAATSSMASRWFRPGRDVARSSLNRASANAGSGVTGTSSERKAASSSRSFMARLPAGAGGSRDRD